MATTTSFSMSFVKRGFGKLGVILRGFGANMSFVREASRPATAGFWKVGKRFRPVAAAAVVRKVGGRIYTLLADGFESCINKGPGNRRSKILLYSVRARPISPPSSQLIPALFNQFSALNSSGETS